jgi:hypothetical protein
LCLLTRVLALHLVGDARNGRQVSAFTVHLCEDCS